MSLDEVPDFTAVLFAPRPEWFDDALCRGTNPRFFHPSRGDQTAHIKAVCEQCPVRPECLDYALRTKQKYGIWGGASERERRIMRHDRGLQQRRQAS